MHEKVLQPYIFFFDEYFTTFHFIVVSDQSYHHLLEKTVTLVMESNEGKERTAIGFRALAYLPYTVGKDIRHHKDVMT